MNVKAFLLPMLFLMVACSQNKPVAEDTSDEAPLEDVMPVHHSGEVTMAFKEKGCPILIKMTSESNFKYLIPVQLDSIYRKEGMKLQFNFVTSRAPQGECRKGQMAVIQDISILE